MSTETMCAALDEYESEVKYLNERLATANEIIKMMSAQLIELDRKLQEAKMALLNDDDVDNIRYISYLQQRTKAADEEIARLKRTEAAYTTRIIQLQKDINKLKTIADKGAEK